MSVDTINRITDYWGKNVAQKDGNNVYKTFYMDQNKQFINSEPQMGTFIKLFIEPDRVTKEGNFSDGLNTCKLETGTIIAQCFTDSGLGKLTLWEIIDRITEVFLDVRLGPSDSTEKGNFYFSDIDPRAVGLVPKELKTGSGNLEWYRHDVFILYRKDFN